MGIAAKLAVAFPGAQWRIEADRYETLMWYGPGPKPTLAEIVAVEIVEPMPAISDRQFGEGLWRDGLIDFDAYLAFVGPGTIPVLFQRIIDTLPDDDTGGPTPRKVALGQATGAKEYQFGNAFVEPLRQAFEAIDPAWTAAHFRDRWRAWASL